MKAELFVPVSMDNSKGYGYSFWASEQVMYYLLFNRIDKTMPLVSKLPGKLDYFLMEFDHTQGAVAHEANIANQVIGATVLDFFSKHPLAVVLGVYDDTKASNMARYRLFDYWFRKYNTESLLKKVNIMTSKDESEMVSIMFKADNTEFLKLL